MRTYIEKLGKEYIEGRKESGKSPLRTGLYGERLRSMSWKRTRLFSYQTHVATAFISYLPNALKPMQISLKDSIIHTKVKT